MLESAKRMSQLKAGVPQNGIISSPSHAGFASLRGASKETRSDLYCKMWAGSVAATALGHVNPCWVFVPVLGFPLQMLLLGEAQLDSISSQHYVFQGRLTPV